MSETPTPCPHCGFQYSGCEPGDCPNTIDPSEATARLAYVNAAYSAAAARNVLTPADRGEFAAALDEHDLDTAEAWALLVVQGLSDRCRSFTPEVLANLCALGRACGAIPE